MTTAIILSILAYSALFYTCNKSGNDLHKLLLIIVTIGICLTFSIVAAGCMLSYYNV